MPGFVPAAEPLLFRQKWPKPLTPRLASLKRRDANSLKSGPTRRAQTRSATDKSVPPGSQPAGVGSTVRRLIGRTTRLADLQLVRWKSA